MTTKVIYETTFIYQGGKQNVICESKEFSSIGVVSIIDGRTELKAFIYGCKYPYIEFTITFTSNDGKIIGSKDSSSLLDMDILDFSEPLVLGETYKIKVLFNKIKN